MFGNKQIRNVNLENHLKISHGLYSDS